MLVMILGRKLIRSAEHGPFQNRHYCTFLLLLTTDLHSSQTPLFLFIHISITYSVRPTTNTSIRIQKKWPAGSGQILHQTMRAQLRLIRFLFQKMS